MMSEEQGYASSSTVPFRPYYLQSGVSCDGQTDSGGHCNKCGAVMGTSGICGQLMPLPEIELPTGWICPACNKSNAPTVLSCPCRS